MSGALGPSNDESRKKLAKARLEAAEKTYEALLKRDTPYLLGEEFYSWSKRILEAQRELASDKAELKTALKAHLERMRQVEKLVQQFADTLKSNFDFEHIPAATYYRVEAELWLEKAD
jgi:hypothetical protein